MRRESGVHVSRGTRSHRRCSTLDLPAIVPVEMDIDEAIGRLLEVASELDLPAPLNLPATPSWTRSALLWRPSACPTTSCACGAGSRAVRPG